VGEHREIDVDRCGQSGEPKPRVGPLLCCAVLCDLLAPMLTSSHPCRCSELLQEANSVIIVPGYGL
jgi:hypothetical protein